MAKRTLPQNKALHLYFTLLSEALNDAGLDMRATLKPEIEIPWTPHSVKEQLWKELQRPMKGVESTTELDTKDVNDIYLILDRHLQEKLGVSVEFPKEREE